MLTTVDTSTTEFRLRRIVLINAGTNQDRPSSRLVEIDPRGGVAVLGPNAVGKTTALRVLPLFFGHQPGLIVTRDQGQKPMVQFVLPTDASAIAFEYQRGTGADSDLRLSVLRRRSDTPDVAFYRLYRCGFDKEMFTDGSDGQRRFLTDEETQLKATERGVATSPKLTTAEYRSVILNVPSLAKDKARLRQLSHEWSFGPKSLDNLDRLVAAMVKKHINFADIVQVAVDMAQTDLGYGADKAKLSFKQSKATIQAWLTNRQACIDAFKLSPLVQGLRDKVQELDVAAARFRARHTDVVRVLKARQLEKAQLEQSMEELEAARAKAVVEEKQRREQLATDSRLAGEESTKAGAQYRVENEKAEHFERHQVASWSERVSEIPELQLRLQTTQAQIEGAEVAQKEAVTAFGRMADELRGGIQARRLTLEQEKQPAQTAHTEAIADVARSEQEQLGAMGEQFASQSTELTERLAPLTEELGSWKARMDSPGVSEAALREHGEAVAQQKRHMTLLRESDGVLARAKERHAQALRAFSQQESDILHAKQLEARSREAYEAALRRLSPAAGTLLAALRGGETESWKKDLARVIDPSLLERTDLDATMVDDEAATLYGWRLNTGSIQTPSWVDDEASRAAAQAADLEQQAATGRVQSLEKGLETRKHELDVAKDALAKAEAQGAVLEGRTEGVDTAVSLASQRIEQEKKRGRDAALEGVRRVDAQIAEIRTQQRQLKERHERDQATLRELSARRRKEAKDTLDAALASISRRALELEEQLRAGLADIERQLNERLQASGIDVVRLNALKATEAQLRNDIRQLQDKLPMVESWREWMASVGPAKVETLKFTALRAMQHARDASDALDSFERQATAALEAFEKAMREKQKRMDAVGDDIETLEQLRAEFGDTHPAAGESAIDPNTTAQTLRGMVKSERGLVDSITDRVAKSTSDLHLQLTGKDSAVRQLVDGHMSVAEGKPAELRAKELVHCFGLIGPQVLTDVNRTLNALLTHIGAFHKAFKSFEREISDFNTKLQVGLNNVQRFERIKDLRLDITTNFENLGFYKKLAKMDELYRLQLDRRELTPSATEPPSEEVARAIGDFASIFSSDGGLEVNLSSNITLRGSLTSNGHTREFKTARELENISSEGLTSLVLITLQAALLNTIRGELKVYVPWVTDEVAKYDASNFKALMTMLRENRIDVITASPDLGPAQQSLMTRRYLFEDQGRVRLYEPAASNVLAGSTSFHGDEDTHREEASA